MSFGFKNIGFFLAALCVLAFLHLREKPHFLQVNVNFHLFMCGFLLTTALQCSLCLWDVVDLI